MGRSKIRKRKRSLRRTPRITGATLDDFVREGHYVFWLAHGANYLASPLKECLWRPLFLIYEGRRYTQTEILTETAILYPRDTSLGETLFAWCRQKPRTVYLFYQELRQRIKDESHQDEDLVLLRPHVEYVWQAFEQLHKGEKR